MLPPVPVPVQVDDQEESENPYQGLDAAALLAKLDAEHAALGVPEEDEQSLRGAIQDLRRMVDVDKERKEHALATNAPASELADIDIDIRVLQKTLNREVRRLKKLVAG